MIKWSSGLVFVLCFAAASFLGCGGKDMKVSLRPAEGEKDGAATALVRKVEVAYHDPKGVERVREALPVLGLSQPVSMRADLLKDVPVEKDGRFEARGYSADGALLLSGQAQADSDSSEAVEIVLDRQGVKPSALGSPLLRRVRLVDSQLPTEFSRDAQELRTELDSQKCLELPPLTIAANAGAHPRIILEGTIKAPSFGVDVALSLGREAAKAVGGRLPLSVNHNGDAELELGRRFLDGLLLRNPAHLVLHIHSDRYEGCLSVTTRPSFEPATVTFTLDQGVGALPDRRRLAALGILEIRNPNLMPVWVHLKGMAFKTGTGEALSACVHHSNDPRPLAEISCVHQPEDVRYLTPGSRSSVCVFGGIDRNGEFTTRAIETRWSVMTGLSQEVQDYPTQVPPNFIP